LFWALWDEAFGQRPWKAFQEQWKTRYTSLLKTQKTKSAQVEKEIEQSSDYQALKQKYEQAGQQATARTKEIRTQLESVGANILAVQNVFTDRRAWVNARTYEMETATSSSSKQSIQKTIDNYKAQPASVVFPDGHKEQYTFQKLEEKYNDLKTERARLNAELGEVSKPVTEAREAMSAYLGEHMVDLTPDQIKGLQDKTALWDPKIVQINIADANIVDRCESCHMGAREPIKITAAAMTSGGKKPDEYAQAFVSHPDKELLGAHDPEKFGCSACHQGNGRATSSVEKAHGDYEHWLWPLYPKQNAEAGCQTCHMADMVLASGEVGKVISDGKDLFRQRGCMGCHRYEGYDREPEELAGIQQQMKALETDKKENSKQSAYLMKQADSAATNEEANQMNQMAIALRVTNTQMDGRIHQLDLQSRSLMQDMKKVGPNLKDARLKLNKNWIPVWLKKPTDFRPTTKMPNFRLNDHQIQAISAYIWQAGLTDALPKQTAGNAAHGKDLFESRGCLACHSIGEGDQMQGGTFAANLSREGEKANFEYLVRWIHNARQRTRPYCPYEKKDIGPEDYAKKGLPFVFDLQHSKCPNDGHELQVQNMTVMPSLRLTPQDSADIATYLLTQKQQDPSAFPKLPS
jgi:cytochrome c2